jgi:S1-C subfamily serine protease
MRVLCGIACLTLWTGAAFAQSPAPPAGTTSSNNKGVTILSASAERIYDAAKPSLLQIRTLVKTSRSQSSIGSGWMVGEDLAITNYHVISSKALEPQLYDLEWVSTGDARGPVRVVAIDVANDLALIRLSDHTGKVGKPFTLADEPKRGERVYSLGRPLDLGFNIMEGTHNGVPESDFNPRFLFSGAINAGMSGGPALTSNGEVYGINVAKNLRGELVSYVVPAKFVRELLKQAQSPLPLDEPMHKTISKQLAGHQTRVMDKFFTKPLPTKALGRYQVAGEAPPLLKCWANTSAANKELQFESDNLHCTLESDVFVSGNLYTGSISYRHTLLTSKELGRLKFARLVDQQDGGFGAARAGWAGRKQITPQRCTTRFVSRPGGDVQAILCVRALKKFDDLYNMNLAITTLDTDKPLPDGARQSLVSTLALAGMTYDNGLKVIERFLETLQWKP